MRIPLLFCLSILPVGLWAQPELEAWLLNTDGATGQYWNGNALVPMQDECDVQLVQYSAGNVYVRQDAAKPVVKIPSRSKICRTAAYQGRTLLARLQLAARHTR